MALPKEYGDLASAEAYFETRLDVDAWASASDVDKKKALATAARMLDDMTWGGRTATSDQEHAFPRVGSYYDRMHQQLISFETEHATRKVRNACFELAYHLLNNDGVLDSSGGVRSLKVGSIELIDIDSASKTSGAFYSKISDMLTGNGGVAGGAVWWRAN